MAYRGLGTPVAGGDAPDNDPALVDPNCGPAEEMFYLCDYQQDQTGAGYKAPIGPKTAPFSASLWLAQNKTAVYLGAGALVLMSIMKGRR